MATVSDISSRVSNTTGLLSSGVELALIVAWMNEAYQRAVIDTGAYTSTATWALTAGTSAYTIGTAPASTTNMLRILHITTNSGGVTNRPLRQAAELEVRDMLEGGSAQGGPLSAYCLMGINKIEFAPVPSSGDTVTLTYVAAPPELVASGAGAGQETTPSAFPAAWHYPLIGTLAQAMAYDYLGNRELADHFMARYQENIGRFVEFAEHFGGAIGSTVYDAEGAQWYPSDPDQRMRF